MGAIGENEDKMGGETRRQALQLVCVYVSIRREAMKAENAEFTHALGLIYKAVEVLEQSLILNRGVEARQFT
jgi:hypothetical protein